MGENAWLSGPAAHEIMFTTPAQDRWRAAALAMGVDIESLSGDIGHA